LAVYITAADFIVVSFVKQRRTQNNFNMTKPDARCLILGDHNKDLPIDGLINLPKNDGSLLENDIDCCVVPYPYPKAVYLAMSEKPYCFLYSHMLFVTIDRDSCKQLCYNFWRLFCAFYK